MRTTLAALLVVVAVTPLAAPSSPGAADSNAAPRPATRDLKISFKLDPRLSGPTYGGEKWVSPRTYQGPSAERSVDARASTVDALGLMKGVSADWSASDPGLLQVSPAHGERVTITARRPGESSVTVKHDGLTRKLSVKAVQNDGNWQVTISS
jgi:hypothetical protein